MELVAVSPLSSTRVFDPRWSEHNRPVSEGAQEARIRLSRPGTAAGVFDPATGSKSPGEPDLVLYEGPARIQALRTTREEALTGEQSVPVATYLVQINFDADPTRVGSKGDKAEVLEVSSNGDPQIVGRKLYVERVLFGSLMWERNIYCSDDEARNNPKGEEG